MAPGLSSYVCLYCHVWTHDNVQATSQVCNERPLKLPARQIPWNTSNTYTLSPIPFADTVSLHPSHKINVPPNRKAILQCITLSEWTSAPQPVSLNLSLICLVLLWALRNNYVLSLPGCECSGCTEQAAAQCEGIKMWDGGTGEVGFCCIAALLRVDAAVSSLIWPLKTHRNTASRSQSGSPACAPLPVVRAPSLVRSNERLIKNKLLQLSLRTWFTAAAFLQHRNIKRFISTESW